MKGGHIRFRRPYSLPSIYSLIEASNSEADSRARPGPLAAKKPVQTKTFQIIQNSVFYSQCHFCTTISAPRLVTIGVLIAENTKSKQKKFEP